MKIMLDDADVSEPQFLRLFGQSEGVVKVFGAGFLLRLHVRKRLDTKFHAAFAPLPTCHRKITRGSLV
jgi:hypothetical protein